MDMNMHRPPTECGEKPEVSTKEAHAGDAIPTETGLSNSVIIMHAIILSKQI
jgi:hypothetical protein